VAEVKFQFNEAVFGDAFRKVEDRFGDLTELMSLLCGRAVKLLIRKFQNSGPGWVPLSKRTLALRRKKGKGAKPLLDTGRLRASLVSEGPSSVKEIGKVGFKLGTNLVYAASHQFGRGHIPARPFMPTQQELEDEFLPLVNRYLAKVLT